MVLNKIGAKADGPAREKDREVASQFGDHSIVTNYCVTLGFAILQGTDLKYQEILGRTEIYMVSVIMLASTKRDIFNVRPDSGKLVAVGRLVESLTPTLIVVCMVYGVIFFDANI